MNEDVEKFRLNSRIKHLILTDYLPTWASILGKWHKRLNYFDCYAGPGRYRWGDKLVDGSPIIAIRKSIELLKSERRNKPEDVNLFFIENNAEQIKKLESEINKINGIPRKLFINISKDDSETLVSELLLDVRNIAPSFFFIDPYGHPFSLKLMSEIMNLDRTEIMVNFMHYQIIRDIENPMKRERCAKLFAPDNPKKLDLKSFGRFDEEKILAYLQKRIGARYFIPFKVYFGPDENVASGKLKYLLIHYSNNYTAFDLMLNIMWKYSEQDKPLMVSDRRPILFPIKDINNLEDKIMSKYKRGDKLSFESIVADNWKWYFRETHFRTVFKELEKAKMIRVKRITSKTLRGLSGNDKIIF